MQLVCGTLTSSLHSVGHSTGDIGTNSFYDEWFAIYTIKATTAGICQMKKACNFALHHYHQVFDVAVLLPLQFTLLLP